MTSVATRPISPPSKPNWQPKQGACDTHAHMIAGPSEFPLWDGRVEDPAPGTLKSWLEMYQLQLDTLGLSRGVLVQSILYGDDNTVISEAIRHLGKDNFRGIAVVTDDVEDTKLDQLAEAGFKGVRLNYVHGGRLTWSGAVAMADRLRARDMHIQALVQTDQHISEIAEDVRNLPIPIVFDHLAWPDLNKGTDESGFLLLQNLLAEGHAWVKLSGVFRLCESPYNEADTAIKALVKANSEHCLWGSDWPHLMLGDAKTPDSGLLLDAFLRAVGSEKIANKILVDNPVNLYGFK